MKQYARVVSKPAHFTDEDWLMELQTFYVLALSGEFITQVKGVFSCVFVDLDKLTLICTILQAEHADPAEVTAIHQEFEKFIQEIQTP